MVPERDVLFGCELLIYRACQARLTDARLSSEERNAASTAFGLLPAAQQELELLLATQNGRSAGWVPRLEAVLNPTGARHLVHMHRSGETLEVMSAEVAVMEQHSEETVRLRADQQRAGLRHRLEARGEIGGLANGRVLLRRPFPHQVAHHDDAGGEADACLQPHALRGCGGAAHGT